jgi:hypothetical protein
MFHLQYKNSCAYGTTASWLSFILLLVIARKNGFVFSNQIGLWLRVGWSQIVTFLGECTLFILVIWAIKVSDDSIIN